MLERAGKANFHDEDYDSHDDDDDDELACKGGERLHVCSQIYYTIVRHSLLRCI